MSTHSKLLVRIAAFASTVTLGSLVLVKGPAQAILVNARGEDHDVQRINTNYNIDKGIMEKEPWWGKRILATEFLHRLSPSGSVVGFDIVSRLVSGKRSRLTGASEPSSLS